MSKIEEALKKAKAAKALVSVNGLKPISALEIARAHSDVQELVPSKDVNGSMMNASSSKEIALMSQGELLDHSQLSDMRIIHPEMSDTKIANTYRDIRTKIIQKSQGRNFIAMLTSCIPGGDNSISSLNLATAFSFDERKTSLLIDCNLNAPHLDLLLNMNADIGLTDYLANEHIDIESIIHATGIKRLKMIPTGTAKESSAEYFTSMRMRQLMTNLLSRYNDRYIFIDAAPISESADTRILAELCDFVLLVVPYGKVTKNKIKEAADATGKDKLLGIIFNDIPRVPELKISNFNRFFGV